MTRTALLVRCSAEEADRIRFEAQKERRTISSYVLRIASIKVATDDRLILRPNSHTANELSSRRPSIPPSRRTAILVRCAVEEAERIRAASRRREIPINAFILRALESTWDRRVPLYVGSVDASRASALQPGD